MDMREVLEAMRINGLHDEADAVGIFMQQRAELMEVLKDMLNEYKGGGYCVDDDLVSKANAAINRAEATE